MRFPILIAHKVLLQQTQTTSASGEKTMTAYYASWYREVLLRKATDFQREVIFSPNKDSFANFIQQGHMIGMMNPEDYTNPQVQTAISPIFIVTYRRSS